MISRRSTFTLALLGLASALAPAVAFAQDLHPSRRLSPLGSARIALGDAYLIVVYGQPYKRGRENIFGTKESKALVPFGERWRTGANEATEIVLTKDLMVAGKKLDAGAYSLTTTPGEKSWKIHFNSQLGLDGTGHFDPVAQKFTPADLPPTDVLVVDVPVAAIPADKEEVDQFTIDFEKTAAGADMVLRWIRTEVHVPVAPAK
jgi:hypothetical protein